MPYIMVDKPYLKEEKPPIESQDTEKYFDISGGGEEGEKKHLPWIIACGLGLAGLIFIFKE